MNEKLGKNTATWKKNFTSVKSPLYFVAIPFWSPEGHIRAERPVWLKNLVKLYWTHACPGNKNKAMAPSSLAPKNTFFDQGLFKHAHVCAHTHTHTHIYKGVCVCVCVCVCVREITVKPSNWNLNRTESLMIIPFIITILILLYLGVKPIYFVPDCVKNFTHIVSLYSKTNAWCNIIIPVSEI